MKCKYGNYFNININELYNDINKMFDLYRRNNNFSGFIKYFNSVNSGCELYSLLSGINLKEKHFLSDYMIDKMNKYDNDKINEFLDYSFDESVFWIKCFGSYGNIIEDKIYNVPIYVSKRIFSKEECIDLIKNFFSKFGIEISNTVNDLFDKNRIVDGNFKDDFVVACCYNLSAIDKRYIVLSDLNKCLVYLLSLVHEIGHVIDYELYDKNTFSSFKHSYMQEMLPMFFHFMFVDFLKNNNIALNEIDNYSALRYIEYYDMMGVIEAITFFEIKELLPSGDIVCISDDGCEIKFPFYNNLIYTLGAYYALHLKYLYFHDKNKFNEVFPKIMRMKGEISSYELSKLFKFDEGLFESGELIKKDVLSPFLRLKK